MQTTSRLTFFTLLLLISFASVNAVLFTPALPEIASFFSITDNVAEQTVTWYLIGYTLGQLVYGPIANRYGRKPALYTGIALQIISSLLCVYSGTIHSYTLLILGRFFLALGAGVGLKMSYTLVSELFDAKIASQKFAYLNIAFAITPGLGVMIGGLLTTHFNWTSTFYAGAIYGLVLLLLTSRLPETKIILDKEALKLHHLITGYLTQFKNIKLIISGFLMGGATCFVYAFAALAPFIAINLLHMNSSTYGAANLLPSMGLLLGSLVSAQLSKHYSPLVIVKTGITIATIGSTMLLIFSLVKIPPVYMLFIPMMFCYFGLSCVVANASTIAMNTTDDKAHGSAVMSFINMGSATTTVLCLGFISTHILTLPILYIFICGAMFFLYHHLTIQPCE